MISKVETLAKLYLDGEPAEIAEQTIDAFCELIMTEFQQLPFAVQAADFMRYETAAEMFADIEQGHLWESVENYDCLQNAAITLKPDTLDNFWVIRTYLKARLKHRRQQNANTSFECNCLS